MLPMKPYLHDLPEKCNKVQALRGHFDKLCLELASAHQIPMTTNSPVVLFLVTSLNIYVEKSFFSVHP